MLVRASEVIILIILCSDAPTSVFTQKVHSLCYISADSGNVTASAPMCVMR
jgi:hypothetical protein